MISISNVGRGTYFEDAYVVSFGYDPSIVAKVKELAQRRYLPEARAWEIPKYELPNLVAKFDISDIKADDSIIGELREKEINERKESVAKRLKDIKPIVDFDFTTKPLPHQIEAFNYGMTKNCILIGDEQGLGKTKESIDIITARRAEVYKCLIVCGVNSVKYNWAKEISKHSREASVIIDGKTMDKRVDMLNDWYNSSELFAIINIESLRSDIIQDNICSAIREGIIGAVIVDEIHKAKNGSSQQGRALRTLRSKIKIGLSGTPMNKAEDLWNILTWLGAERRSYFRFRSNYCIMGGYGNYQVVGHKNLEELNAQLNSVMLRRRKEEVLDLPPKTYHTEFVELTAKQKILYREIRSGIIDNLEEILKLSNPLVCTLRLRQLTGGLFSEDNAKLDRVKEMLAEDIIPNGNKAIIFSQWEKVTALYNEALQEFNPIYITGALPPEERQKAVDRFQEDPNCKIAIGTIGAMGTGLTLNKASYVFFIDKKYNSGENEQAEDRAHRIGTTGTVNIISMVAKGTVDEGIENYLVENKELFDKIVNGKCDRPEIKALLKKLLNIA